MTIPKQVKRFIEENIDSIQSRDWKTFFENWYFDPYGENHSCDYYIDELFECLESAGIDVRAESYTARKEILVTRCEDIFKHLMLTNKTITVSKLLYKLNSTLNFDENALGMIFDIAAKTAGLAKATNGWYRV